MGGVVFVVVWVLCLVCVCYFVLVVFVIVWGLCLLLPTKFFVSLFHI